MMPSLTPRGKLNTTHSVEMKRNAIKHGLPTFHSVLCIIYFMFNFPFCSSINNSSEQIILSCGSAESLSFNGVRWIGDVGSEFVPALSDRTAITAITKVPDNMPRIPYSTARVFRSRFVYSFPTSPGVKFIRFHFYPSSYSGIDNISKAYFSVTTGKYTLLDSFRPSSVANIMKSVYFSKEFIVGVKENVLNITFTPSVIAPETFAFVNGIEIRSMALNLQSYAGNTTSSAFSVQDEPALEMLYRVNIAGQLPLSPFWTSNIDNGYILGSEKGTEIWTAENITYPSGIASEYGADTDLYNSARIMDSDEVNMKYNLTWAFTVDSGFKYLVRLHFCEISFDVKKANERVFKVRVNNRTVEKNLDLVALAGKPLVAIYRDYFVEVPEGAGERHDIWVALHPNTESNPKFANAILNGIEIIKISNSSGNLAAHMQLTVLGEKKIHSSIIFSGVFGGLGFLILFCFTVYWLVSIKLPQLHLQIRGNTTKVIITPVGHCRKFTLAEIKAATTKFCEAHVLGVGGFGKVYKGMVDDGLSEVAIKRGNPKAQQGVKEFENEIELLSTFCHKNLVCLLGFCQEEKELILVYNYMAHGTLRDHLYNTQNPPLSWNNRLQICIGAARGLHYLHTGTENPIVHRDIKSTNILLDQDWVAKVSDFGLSKIVPVTTSRRHVSTEVKGTFGYLDPRYYHSKRLTEKSDVYSFGVVLFEVLCARPAVNHAVRQEDERVSLAQWAIVSYENDTIQCMVDPFLRGKIASECLNTFVNIAIKCLADRRAERPSMSDVLGNLEKALQLQKAADSIEGIEDELLLIIDNA